MLYRNGNRTYYQISASVLDPNTFHRKITPLKRVNDNYRKSIITMDELLMDDKEIKIINIIDFLLEEYD